MDELGRPTSTLNVLRFGPSCLESFGIQVAKISNAPVTVSEDAKRKSVELEIFEYQSKKSRVDGTVEGIGDTGGESAEETTASLACLETFKRLPESLLSSVMTSAAKHSCVNWKQCSMNNTYQGSSHSCFCDHRQYLKGNNRVSWISDSTLMPASELKEGKI